LATAPRPTASSPSSSPGLPEVLAGYDRSATAGPVPYPHSCSPQAWAAATPLALGTALDRS
jgi:glycogen debranching enzyme